ncbi:MAG: ATP synthase F0 subunit B [Bryobacteraceae bacterium]
MRRATLAILLGLALASCALPQESPASTEKTEQGDPLIWWKWANFAILAFGLGYLIRKHVPPIFRKQSDEIQSALAEAAKIKHEAALYAASVEQRLADLQREIENLRETAHADMAAESERIRIATEHHVQRIREQSVQEIDLMTRGAKAEIRKYAAELAIGLAEQRIRTRMNPATQENLVSGFLHDLHERAPRTAN